jgi:hypothetical protein
MPAPSKASAATSAVAQSTITPPADAPQKLPQADVAAPAPSVSAQQPVPQVPMTPASEPVQGERLDNTTLKDRPKGPKRRPPTKAKTV